MTNKIDTQAPKRNTIEDFRFLSHQIMHLALRGLLRIDFLNEASKILMEFSGGDSVQMWLKERGKYYSSEVTRSKKRPFHFEIIPTMENDKGRVILPKDIRPGSYHAVNNQETVTLFTDNMHYKELMKEAACRSREALSLFAARSFSCVVGSGRRINIYRFHGQVVEIEECTRGRVCIRKKE